MSLTGHRNCRSIYSDKYREYFELHSDISTRDSDGIHKTFSGLMKILYPHGEASKEEIEEILRFAIEGRKRVKDQLMRIDSTFQNVRFGYVDLSTGQEKLVKTLEEEEYPQYFKSEPDDVKEAADNISNDTVVRKQPKMPAEDLLEQGNVIYQENQRGVTFDALFGPYLKGATRVVITDPYIRIFYQARNLMEFLETIARQKAEEDEIEVHLITILDEFKGDQQFEFFEKIETSCAAIGIKFSWEFDGTNTIHARHIELDNGWKILLDRGLDIYQHFDMGDAFSFSNRGQQYRSCKGFEVTYLKG